MCHGTLPLYLGVPDRRELPLTVLVPLPRSKSTYWTGLCPPYVDFGEVDHSGVQDGVPDPVIGSSALAGLDTHNLSANKVFEKTNEYKCFINN